MRSLLFLALAVTAACLSDRPDHVSSQGDRDAGADADARPPPYECHFATSTSSDGIAGFRTTTPYDYAVRRLEWLKPGAVVAEIFETYEEWGTPTSTAKARIDALRFCDPEKCPNPIDMARALEIRGDGQAWPVCSGTTHVGGAPSPGYYVEELVFAQGDDVTLVTLRSDLVSFFGTIDTKSEAMYVAMRDGFQNVVCQWDRIVETDDGFDLPMVAGDCRRAPGGPANGFEEIILHVGRDAQTRITSRQPIQL